MCWCQHARGSARSLSEAAMEELLIYAGTLSSALAMTH